MINELSRFVPQGVFIDDCPAYINDVVEHCPGILTIWMNTLNIASDNCHPHYEVKNWTEVNAMLFGTDDFEDLMANSAHPGIQQRLAV